MAILETVLKFVFAYILYPMALELAKKREVNPEFKAASDETYGALKTAQTTADRKAAARKLYELQKNA